MLCAVGRRTPRCRGYGAGCFKELCGEELDVRTKGEGSIKNNAEKLGSGLKVREVPVRVSWG